MFKRLSAKTSFRLVYEMEIVLLMDFLVPSLHIALATQMIEFKEVEKWLQDLLQSKEYRALTSFHLEVKKAWDKSWHDWIIKHRKFQEGDLVLRYNNKFLKHLGKFQMHWMGPYVIHHVTDGGVEKLRNINGMSHEGFVNVSKLKLYRDNQTHAHCG